MSLPPTWNSPFSLITDEMILKTFWDLQSPINYKPASQNFKSSQVISILSHLYQVFIIIIRSEIFTSFILMAAKIIQEKTKYEFYRKQQVVGNMTNGKISKRVLQENKARQVFRKTNISYPLIQTRGCVCVKGVRSIRFFRNFGKLCFLGTPTLRFALLPYCRLGMVDFWIAINFSPWNKINRSRKWIFLWIFIIFLSVTLKFGWY